MIDMLLPIGTVVRVLGVDQLVVILGFFPDNGEEVFDYLAAPYPSGLASEDHFIFLNEADIVEIVARGYLDEAGKQALEAATVIMNAREEAYVTIGQALEDAGEFQVADMFTMD